MVTMRAQKLQTCQLGMPRWSIRQRPTSAGIRTSFHRGPSSPRSNVFQYVPRTPGCWHSCPSVCSDTGKNLWVPLSELYLFFFWQLSQRHWHWWWHSAAGKRSPECRPLWRPKWRCAQSSMAAMSNRQAACCHHGPARVVPSFWECRLESKHARCSCDVVFYWSCACKRKRECQVSTVAPHRQVCDLQSMQPSLKPMATLIALLSRWRPQAAISRTCNQSPLWSDSDDAASSRARWRGSV